MDVASILLTAVAPKAVRALIGGEDARGDAALDAVSAAVETLLKAMLKTEDATAATLHRIEGKIDALARERFGDAIQVG